MENQNKKTLSDYIILLGTPLLTAGISFPTYVVLTYDCRGEVCLGYALFFIWAVISITLAVIYGIGVILKWPRFTDTLPIVLKLVLSTILCLVIGALLTVISIPILPHIFG